MGSELQQQFIEHKKRINPKNKMNQRRYETFHANKGYMECIILYKVIYMQFIKQNISCELK